jgi:hypothetical protein
MSATSLNLTASGAAHVDGKVLSALLRHAAQRIRLLRLLRSGSAALCWGALACLLLVGGAKLMPGHTPAPVLLLGLIAFSLLLGALHALLPRLTELDVARATEQRADLKERLSSAVEFQQSGISAAEPFYGALYRDANLHAGAVDLKQLYPARLPRTLPVGILMCCVLFGAYFLPGLPVFWSRDKKAEMAEVKARGIELLKVVEDKQKTADQQKLDETKKAAAEARKLAEAMKHGQMNKKEALVAMQKLTKKMEDQQRKLADQQAPKTLDQAGKEFKKSMEQIQKDVERARKDREAQAAQKNMAAREMKQALDKAAQQKQSEAMKQAMQAMQQMSQAMANQSPQQMQQAMQQMAKAMQQGNMSKQEMQQMAQMMQAMAQALQNTQMNPSAQEMQQMAQMMQAMQNMDAKTMQQLAEMMKKMGQGMGKNPGEGMQMMDAKALAELMQALKDGRLTMAGNKPGFGGKQPGMGAFGHGGENKAMKDPEKTNPRLMIANQKGISKSAGKKGSIQDLIKYLSMSSPPPKHLPNARINGERTKDGQELTTQLNGDPEPTQSNSPYYRAVETSKRQAESTLNKENIPAAMRQQVRDYFDSIKP